MSRVSFEQAEKLILAAIKLQPRFTQAVLRDATGLGVNAVRRHLDRMVLAGTLREEPQKGSQEKVYLLVAEPTNVVPLPRAGGVTLLRLLEEIQATQRDVRELRELVTTLKGGSDHEYED